MSEPKKYIVAIHYDGAEYPLKEDLLTEKEKQALYDIIDNLSQKGIQLQLTYFPLKNAGNPLA